MGESALQDRLARIERRQRILLVLLVVPYFVGLGEVLDYWVAGVLGAACALVVLVVGVRRRRRTPAAGR
ncbi:hypothetical protein [Halorarum salinum]|uniref:Uncharacterized protein n=1 Tax=Halorarum salinum TaxID=2743089 RepID=A0A7D5L9L1_9EURY|nr:hypothetical protein [Halobaculum salinum]QLG61314.1 hypothetical protein HUG12_06015 [Halobaculum salinum]